MEKNKKHRLIAEVSKELHKEIKIISTWKNLSVKEYIIQAITKQLTEDKKYQ